MKLTEFLMKMTYCSGMSQKEVAEKCGIPTPALNEILRGKRTVSAKYAIAFEKTFGIPAIVWLTYQSYDNLLSKEETK